MVELSDGGFAIVWTDENGDGSSSAVRARLYAADGTPRGGDIILNETTLNSQFQPQIVETSPGVLAAVWTTNDGTEIDFSSNAVRARLFAIEGTPEVFAVDLNGAGAGVSHGVQFVEGTDQGTDPADGVAVAAADAALINPDAADPIATVTVTLTNPQGDDGEALVFTGTESGYTIGGDGTSEITITRTTGTEADLEDALRAIRFQNDDDNPTETTRIIEVTAVDGSGDEATSTTRIGVQKTNDVAELTGDFTGAVTEDDAAAAQASGTVTVADADDGEAQISAYGSSTDLGTFAIDAAGDWTFDINNASSSVQALSAGQIATRSFSVFSVDGSAGSSVSISVTGANDAVTFGGGDFADGVSELPAGSSFENVASFSLVGFITYRDVDLLDSHFLFAAPTEAGYRGSMTASIFESTAGDGVGLLRWNYAVDDSALAGLAAGETETETFAIVVDDSNGGASQVSVTITLTGANDAATFAGDLLGSVVEDSGVAAMGTATASDVDNADNVFQAASGTAAHGTFAVDAAGPGPTRWTIRTPRSTR